MHAYCKNRNNTRELRPLSQYRILFYATLVSVILVGCNAEVMQPQVAKGPLERNEQVISITTTEPIDLISVQNTTPADAAAEIKQVVSVSGANLGRQPAAENSSLAVSAPGDTRLVRERVPSGGRINSGLLYRIDADAVRPFYGPSQNRENYLELTENSVKLVSEAPVSTFSIDVDTAAYSNLRRMLMREGRLPPHDAIRLEEMINYFDYDYAAPTSLEQPLAVHTELSASPWNSSNQLLMIGIKGYEPAPEQRPNANLVFLVDVSGSMQAPDKLGLVKRSLKLLVDQMSDQDQIALVVYAGAAGMVLDSTSAAEKTKIHNAIDSLSAGGSTNGAAGIQLAYRIAEDNMIEGGINRIIIASDGDLNVGVTSIDALKELIRKHRDNGVALSTLGFGSGNYNYSLMEQIADVGNGSAAYIDSLNEARKVLIEELQSTLLIIAKDVKIQIEFNPAVVSEYRLLGYENRILNREDFVNDRVDAGEVGAGHTVTALYEVTLVGSDGGLIPPRRYNSPSQSNIASNSDELAYVKIRYKRPDQDQSTEMAITVMAADAISEAASGSNNIRFAAAVAGFGQLLQGGKYISDWSYDDLLQFARQARGSDPHGYRSEMLNMIEMAKLL